MDIVIMCTVIMGTVIMGAGTGEHCSYGHCEYWHCDSGLCDFGPGHRRAQRLWAAHFREPAAGSDGFAGHTASTRGICLATILQL